MQRATNFKVKSYYSSHRTYIIDQPQSVNDATDVQITCVPCVKIKLFNALIYSERAGMQTSNTFDVIIIVIVKF